MIDLDTFTNTSLAKGEQATIELEKTRSEKLGKVFVTPEIKAILSMIGEKTGQGGASWVAAMLIQELHDRGELEKTWKARQNRFRRKHYHKKYNK